MKRLIWKKLLCWKNKPNRKPLILKGARQVGKTWILKEFGKEYFPSFHYINFEKNTSLASVFKKDLDPVRILDELSFFLNKGIDIEEDLIVFDEIQEVPEALTSLKYFHEEMPNLRICAAGSLIGIHLNEMSFPVGKVEFLSMYPMSFEEFLMSTDDKGHRFISSFDPSNGIPDLVHQHLWEKLKRYFVVGGLPEAVLTYANEKEDGYETFQRVREVQKNLILAYQADMAKHSGKVNSMNIERVWSNIPSQLAKEINGSAPKYVFRGVLPNTSRFSALSGSIDWLEKAGLLIKTKIVNKSALPLSAFVAGNAFKLYSFDVGILGALGEINPKTILQYDYGNYQGYFAENFVAQEFLCSGAEELYCWRENTAEIEFLREVEGELLPIEIKSGWVTKAKSLKVYAEKYNPPYRTKFSANSFFLDRENNVHRYPLYLASKFPV